MRNVAVIQMTSSENIENNLNQATKFIKNAVNDGAKLIVLPENFALFTKDTNHLKKNSEQEGCGLIQDFLKQTAQTNNIWIVGGTIPLKMGRKITSSSLLIDHNGNQVARYDKIHLFDVTLKVGEQYMESKTFKAGKDVIVADSPFGKIGMAVCYDLRFPELFRKMALKGAEIITLPSAFTYTTGVAHWEVLLRARAIENQVYMVAANQCGLHLCDRKTYGNSMIVNPWGEILARASESERQSLNAACSMDFLLAKRQMMPVLSHIKKPLFKA